MGIRKHIIVSDKRQVRTCKSLIKKERNVLWRRFGHEY